MHLNFREGNNRPFHLYALVSKHKEMRMRLGLTISMQITVSCPPEPQVGAVIYRNAGKVYWS